MDTTVKMTFEEVLRRFDSFYSEWEAKFAEVESVCRDWEVETVHVSQFWRASLDLFLEQPPASSP
jgi:hypothetical protein